MLPALAHIETGESRRAESERSTTEPAPRQAHRQPATEEDDPATAPAATPDQDPSADKDTPVIRIIKDGQDPLTRPIIDYLATTYGMPEQHIKSVQLISEVGAPQIITLTLLVQVEPGITCAKCGDDHHEDNHDEETMVRVPLLKVKMRDDIPFTGLVGLPGHPFEPRESDDLCGAVVPFPVRGVNRDVPCGAPRYHGAHDMGPTGDGNADLRAAAARLNAAHGPSTAQTTRTTCVYMVQAPGGSMHECGELIRREYELVETGATTLGIREMVPGRYQWVHASDGRLGTSAHPATPDPTLGL